MKSIIFFFVYLFILAFIYEYNYIYIYNILYFNYKYTISKSSYNYLILSFALNYNFSKIKNFILSLNKTEYNGEFILITNSYINSLKKSILSYRLYNIKLFNKYPYYPYNDSKYPISLTNIKKNLYYYTGKSFVTYRYFIIKLFIKYYGYRYKFILLVDIRDVLFQLNPFEWNINKGIYLVEEHPKRVIGGDKSNILYVKKYNPTHILYKSKVINGGVMYGSYPEILLFLTDFLVYICLFNCNGNDQGGLNSFIRTKRSFSYPMFILNSSHTPVKTLALWLFDSNKCCIPINNTIVNVDFSIPHLIHQYDRAVKALTTDEIYLNIYIKYLDYYTH